MKGCQPSRHWSRQSSHHTSLIKENKEDALNRKEGKEFSTAVVRLLPKSPGSSSFFNMGLKCLKGHG